MRKDPTMETDPAVRPRGGAVASAEGQILSALESGRARSRGALTAALGLSRATLAQKLGGLIEAGLVREVEETLPSGGRPTRILDIDRGFAVILAADVGEDHVRVAVTDLTPRILAETTEVVSVKAGPVAVLGVIVRRFRELLGRIGRPPGEVLGIGLSLPAPVDYAGGRVFGPSVMLGWDDFDIRGWVGERMGAPVHAENDVNVLTLAEHRRRWPDVEQMVYVKLGTGIGSGIITDGRLYRGARGAAGDIGHIQFARSPAPLCRCGKVGCVEARAAGWAIARDLRAEGIEAHSARDVTALVRLGEPLAIHLVRESGRILGEVVASLVSILNPGTIVIGGTLSDAEDVLMAGIRETVHQRSLPLATRELGLVVSRPAPDAGIAGCALLAREEAFSLPYVDALLARLPDMGRR